MVFHEALEHCAATNVGVQLIRFPKAYQSMPNRIGPFTMVEAYRGALAARRRSVCVGTYATVDGVIRQVGAETGD